MAVTVAELTALSAELAAAEGPSYELDLKIEKVITGWGHAPLAYTSSVELAAHAILAGDLHNKFNYVLWGGTPVSYYIAPAAMIMHYVEDDERWTNAMNRPLVRGATLALALCAAAIEHRAYMLECREKMREDTGV